MGAKKKVDWWLVILALSMGVLSFVHPHLMREYQIGGLSLILMGLARGIKNSTLMLAVIIVCFVVAMVCVVRIIIGGG